MKQTIEIEVPEGKVAVYKDNKIIFEDNYEHIKTVGDAINYLQSKHICPNIIDSYNRIPYSAFEHKIISYRAVVAALTNNEKRNLTIGEKWYPSVELYDYSIKNYFSEDIIGRIKSEGRQFVVVGRACYDSNFGISGIKHNSFLINTSSHVAFTTVGNKKVAEYISKQFGKLLFEIAYGGINCDWEWVA